MHQTKKGSQYFFGLKAHMVPDAEPGLVHSVVVTAANVADVTPGRQVATRGIYQCGLRWGGKASRTCGA